ncbi:MAG: hypothetical protein IPH44_17825 [Myxococcales bacterium]|nr:hypothetical protein [Myxococcales bacterium]
MRRAALVALALAAAPAAAVADEPAPWLFPRRVPMPTTLAMRVEPTTTPAATAAVAPPTPTTTTTTTTTTPTPPRRRRRAAAPRREPAPPRFTAQLALGMAVDGANLRNLTGAEPPIGITTAGSDFEAGKNFRPARSYAFGEAFLGSRGLAVPGISAYLASRFRLAPATGLTPPLVDGWDRVDPVQVQSAWTEADGVIDTGPLRTLRIRGGRQFLYGPAVAHVDGLAVAWSTRWLKLGAYLGSRVPDWNTASFGNEPRRLVSGGEVALTLREGPRPLTVRLRGLRYDGGDHGDVTVDWVPRTDVALTLTSRAADGAVARHRLGVRIRVSDETRLAFEADLRRRADWLWDYERRDDDPSRPRRYLDLGPTLPRTTVRARAGTVLLDNIDALIFAGLAFDGSRLDDTPSYAAAGWAEGGGAFEIRMRRTVAVTLSGLARVYSRKDAIPAVVVVDQENQIQTLTWPTSNVGERNLVEGGAQVRFTGGARKFSASAEIYARRTRYARLYLDDAVAEPLAESIDPLTDTVIHGGGRFVFEAWISPRLRLRTEYELSNRFAAAPEIAGLKALRIIAEGRY